MLYIRWKSDKGETETEDLKRTLKDEGMQIGERRLPGVRNFVSQAQKWESTTLLQEIISKLVCQE